MEPKPKPSSLDEARAFLVARRIAIVGLSRNEKDFSRMVMRELVKRGYDVVPVHPSMREAEGRPCFARVQDVRPPVEAALVMTAPSASARVVQDCAEAGVRSVWLHRGGGAGAASAEALSLCAARGIRVVQGLCPFMALPGASFPHRLHGFLRRLGGRGGEAVRPAR